PGTGPAAALGSPSPGKSAAAAGGTAVSGGAGATVTGAAWPTIYGPVQVRVTVAGGKITAVRALEYPVDTPRDAQINSFAIPQLNSETLAAGNAKIDTVSGATYTSQGYIGSLQNALDQAGRS
ncbi:MAG TPA: FMN-binding protein, partial [Trebonia sp.]